MSQLSPFSDYIGVSRDNRFDAYKVSSDHDKLSERFGFESSANDHLKIDSTIAKTDFKKSGGRMLINRELKFQHVASEQLVSMAAGESELSTLNGFYKSISKLADNSTQLKIWMQNYIRKTIEKPLLGKLDLFDRAQFMDLTKLNDAQINFLTDNGLHFKIMNQFSGLQKISGKLKEKTSWLKQVPPPSMSLYEIDLSLGRTNGNWKTNPRSTAHILKFDNFAPQLSSAQSVRIKYMPHDKERYVYRAFDYHLADFFGKNGTHNVLILPDIFNPKTQLSKSQGVTHFVQSGFTDAKKISQYGVNILHDLPALEDSQRAEIIKLLQWTENAFAKDTGQESVFLTKAAREWLKIPASALKAKYVLPFLAACTLLSVGSLNAREKENWLA